MVQIICVPELDRDVHSHTLFGWYFVSHVIFV